MSGSANFGGMSHPSGPSNFSAMSHGPSGPSNFSAMSHGPSGPSNFAQGVQGRTLYNQEHGNRDIRGDIHGQVGRLDRDDLRHGHQLYNRHDEFGRERFDRDSRIGRDIDHDRFGHFRDRDIDLRHRGIVRGDFFEHGRHFRFRRFFNGEWVFLTDWDDCTAWAWVHIAPGVWAWRPVDICIG
jgi:hypothetical protein